MGMSRKSGHLAGLQGVFRVICTTVEQDLDTARSARVEGSNLRIPSPASLQVRLVVLSTVDPAE